MKHRLFITYLLFLITLSCEVHKKGYILSEKDLIPEGTAYSHKNKVVYISSIYKQKIVAISQDGAFSDIMTKAYFGDMSPIGIEVEQSSNTLWINASLAPIINQSGKSAFKTSILAFDLNQNKLIKEYPLIDIEKAFFNDITVLPNGNVFVTDTWNHAIYWINKKTNTLELFLELKKFQFPNGITFHKSTNHLFVTTNQGIIKINPITKKVTLLKVKSGIDTKVIDGLAIHENYFIGHQSNKVTKFYFDTSLTQITSYKVLDSGIEFDSSTTGEIGKGSYYFIVNSQIKSGINYTIKRVKSLDSLENIIIRKLKL